MNGECHRRNRSVEFRAFLDSIEASVAADLEVHLILDNGGIHDQNPKPSSWTKSADQILAGLAQSSRPASDA